MKGIITSSVNMKERAELGIKPGDTVRVWQKIEERGKTRLQAFEGLVLARKHGNEPGGTFTVRKVASGVGVEKIFPLYSPVIDKLEIIKRSKVRHAKLYYIREKVAREAKRALRRMRLMELATQSEQEQAEAKKRKEEVEKAKAEKTEEEIVESVTENLESKEVEDVNENQEKGDDTEKEKQGTEAKETKTEAKDTGSDKKDKNE